jgi:proteasome accessory factor B
MNLLFVLVNAKRPLSRERIRELVPGYPESQIAFERMFERDKDELRRAGIAVVTKPIDDFFEDSLGYLVDSPTNVKGLEITLEEVALIRLAEQAWRDPELRALATSGALTVESTKLTKRANSTKTIPTKPTDGGLADMGSLQSIEMMNQSLSSKVVPIIEAIRLKRRLGFNYRSSADAPSTSRVVEPWRVFFKASTWYLLGFDVEAQGARTFRLSRMTTKPRVTPDIFQAEIPSQDQLDGYARFETTYDKSAQLLVFADAPWEVRSYFRSVMRIDKESAQGFEGAIGYWDSDEFATYLIRFAGHFQVLQPPELVRSVARAAESLMARLN